MLLPQQVSEVYPVKPRAVLRCGPVGGWAFSIKKQGTVEIKRFDSEDAAHRERSLLVVDRDAQDRALDRLMVDHYHAQIDPQPDGTWEVIVDEGAARFEIDGDGEVTCVASEEDF